MYLLFLKEEYGLGPSGWGETSQSLSQPMLLKEIPPGPGRQPAPFEVISTLFLNEEMTLEMSCNQRKEPMFLNAWVLFYFASVICSFKNCTCMITQPISGYEGLSPSHLTTMLTASEVCLCGNVLKTKFSANILLALVVYVSMSPASFLSFIYLSPHYLAHNRHLINVSDILVGKGKNH